MEWSQTYPGLPSMVPAIRAFVCGLLNGSPRRGDAELIAAELAANSIRHTLSDAGGGELSITVTIRPGWARIAVTDSGTGAWGRPEAHDLAAEHGRGLIIIEQTADRLGHDVGAEGQTMWAELTWSVEA
ncbi:ATP-binding protein [Actinomadura sp. KC06]|uniref:ATP-binding protein n=1 Tax=Actinomadura sp. KC06 TaxID=2530369 RepID=UPI0010434BA2|nr:ATP-binding protein [Actinomadura sp. KC06]TDD33735.1 ATP-binding protein [Actinomadura sp. KC06]